MSRFLTKNEDGTYLEEIESMEECKWKINEVCCNDSSYYCCDFPGECTEKEHYNCYEKENGVINNK